MGGMRAAYVDAAGGLGAAGACEIAALGAILSWKESLTDHRYSIMIRL